MSIIYLLRVQACPFTRLLAVDQQVDRFQLGRALFTAGDL